jgi:hypothetical protein
VAGHLVETKVVPEVGEIGEERDDPAVVGFQERLEGQDGGQFVVGEVLPAVLRRVRRQGLPGQAQYPLGHRPRGLGHRVFAPHAR